MKKLELPKRRITLAKRIGKFLKENKAEAPVLLDLRKLWDEVDFFVIVTGQSTRHNQALCDRLIDALEEINIKPHHIEGYSSGDWILVDIGDIVVHIFSSDARDYYNLEMLWGPAMKYEL